MCAHPTVPTLLFHAVPTLPPQFRFPIQHRGAVSGQEGEALHNTRGCRRTQDPERVAGPSTPGTPKGKPPAPLSPLFLLSLFSQQ